MKNIIVTSPKVGDILILDAQKRIKYIAADTYDSASFPAGCETVGIVAERQGNQVLIAHKRNTTQKWSEVYRWKVSGWTLDGSSHETTISFYSSQAKPSNPVFSYKAASIDEIPTQLNTWFDAYYAESNERYFSYVEDGVLRIVQETYDAWWEYSLTMSGLSVSYDVGMELDAHTSTYAVNGLGSVYKGMHWQKFYEYMHDTTSGTFNPTEPLSGLSDYPVSFKCYISPVCDAVRTIYGEGEEGYEAYLRGYMVEFPSQRGAFELKYRSGLEATRLLSGDTYQSHDGSSKKMYPAFAYCADVNYGHPLLAKGQWFLPSMYELVKLFSHISTDYTDIVSRNMAAIGGSRIYFSGSWSSCRRIVNLSWIFNGYSGYSNHNAFGNRDYAVPCLLLDLSGSEEL